MKYSISPNASQRVHKAAQYALNTLQSSEFHLALQKVERFKDSILNGKQISKILNHYVSNPDLVIKIVMYYSRRRVNAYVNKNQPDVIKFNSRNDNRPIVDMAATIIHEFVHCVDTLSPDDNSIDHGHRSNSIRYNYNCAPNTAARITKQLILASQQRIPHKPISEDSYLPSAPDFNFKNLSLNKKQYIAIGKDGKLSDYGSYRTSHSDIESLVAYLKEKNIKKLAIYCHGGLVNEHDGATAIDTVLSVLNDNKDENFHSIGFVWKTGVGEIFKEKIIQILSNGLSSLLVNRMISYVRRRLGHSILDDDFYTIQRYLDGKFVIDDVLRHEGEPNFTGDNKSKNKQFSDFNEHSLDDDLNRDAEDLIAELDELNDPKIDSMWSDFGSDESINFDLLNDIFSDFNEHGELYRNSLNKSTKYLGRIKMVYRIISGIYRRFKNGTWHGNHATVVEEILRVIYVDDITRVFWDEMKNKAAKMWEEGSAANLLFAKINNECTNIEIEFIGHSAGANCGAGMLKYLANETVDNIKVNTISLLAPATDYDLFRDSYMAYRNTYKTFSMYAMTDIAERQDNLIDIPVFRHLYPSSLLYLISGIMESKIDTRLVGMQRFGLESYRNRHPGNDDVYNFLYEENKLILTPIGKYTVADHGDFDDDTYVILPEIKQLMKNT